MKNIYIGLTTFIVTVLLGYTVTHNTFNITYIDRTVAHFFEQIRTPVGVEIMHTITTFGETSILTSIIFLALLFFLLKKHWEFGVVFSLGIGLTAYLMSHMKDYFAVSRPSPFFSTAAEYSYPSGHTSNTSIVFLILGMYFLTVKNRIVKWIGLSICAVSIIAVGVSRMYLNVHWFTDVLGGFLLALSCTLVLYGIVQIFEKKKA